MKRPTIGILAMLVVMSIMSTALACPEGVNCIDVYNGDSGWVQGDSNYATKNNLDSIKYANGNTKVTVTSGYSAKVLIPEGSQGAVYAYLSKSGGNQATPYLNGDQYLLDTAYCGIIKLGAEKYSDNGVESAEAKLLAKAVVDNGFSDPYCPTCKSNKLTGEAEVSASTTSTGVGGTYAIVDNGKAEYFVAHACPFCPVMAKYIEGEAKGDIELRTCNEECPECCLECDTPVATGSKKVNAKIYTTSDANNYAANSKSSVTLDSSAQRGLKGLSKAWGQIKEFETYSAASDGTNPLDYGGWNAQTAIIGSGILTVDSYAFAAKDAASAKASITTQANSNQKTSTNSVLANAQTNMAVKRLDLNNPSTNARADAQIYNTFFGADARDLRSSTRDATVEAYLNNMQSQGRLNKKSPSTLANGIYNNINLDMAATAKNDDIATASITKKVNNYGPTNGLAADYSKVDESARDLAAIATSPDNTAAVTIDSETIKSWIFGNSNPGTGSIVNNNVVADNVNGPSTTSAQGKWTMTWKANSA